MHLKEFWGTLNKSRGNVFTSLPMLFWIVIMLPLEKKWEGKYLLTLNKLTMSAFTSYFAILAYFVSPLGCNCRYTGSGATPWSRLSRYTTCSYTFPRRFWQVRKLNQPTYTGVIAWYLAVLLGSLSQMFRRYHTLPLDVKCPFSRFVLPIWIAWIWAW